MATAKGLSLICEIRNFANAYLGKVTKFQGYGLFRFGVLSLEVGNTPGMNRVKDIHSQGGSSIVKHTGGGWLKGQSLEAKTPKYLSKNSDLKKCQNPTP